MRVVLLHAYSTANIGDGLLVTESQELIREAFAGSSVDFELVAHRPETFGHFDGKIWSALPFNGRYPWFLRGDWHGVKLFVAVGGGYLRAGHASEAIKTLVAHGPQLMLASRHGAHAVYLPQSIGPAITPLAHLLRSRARLIHRIFLRDDRSVSLLATANISRTADLALHKIARERGASTASYVAGRVLTVRPVSLLADQMLVLLAARMRPFSGFIQSETGSNNDRAFMESLSPHEILSREAFYLSSPPRVVVAVRLHAALMAIAAGHYVIHLAYERKGFGAFNDLGIDGYVHNVKAFDLDHVIEQARLLETSQSARTAYDAALLSAGTYLAASRREVVAALRSGAET